MGQEKIALDLCNLGCTHVQSCYFLISLVSKFFAIYFGR